MSDCRQHVPSKCFNPATRLHGEHDGVMVKALRYKPAGRGFDSRWRRWNFSET